jgi:hypothetical protein
MWMDIRFRATPIDVGPGATLIGAMRVEMADLYGGDLDGPDMPKAGPAELGLPHGAFIVGWSGGEPVCCGGFNGCPTARARSSGCSSSPPCADEEIENFNANPVASFFGEKSLPDPTSTPARP